MNNSMNNSIMLAWLFDVNFVQWLCQHEPPRAQYRIRREVMNCASFATRAQDKFNGTLSNEKNRNRHHWIKREIHAIVDYCRYIVDYHFHSVLHRIQEGTSIDIPWWWNQTDKLRYFGTVKTYHKSSEGKRQKSTDWMNKSLKKNENVKMFAKRQFLLICYPKVTNS